MILQYVVFDDVDQPSLLSVIMIIEQDVPDILDCIVYRFVIMYKTFCESGDHFYYYNM